MKIEITKIPSSKYSFGGNLQTSGSDFSTGLVHIDEGGSHSENPNEGVQIGVDPQGIPNLVEEGEVIWNDYVFSARIRMDNESKEVFHINKKRDIAYADQAKRLEREIKERPNDPISKAAFNAQMEKLMEQQERQKAEMEAQRAQEAFAALSPEEQTAVMQQVAQQEQAAQDAAIQQQVMAQQQAMQPQMSPEEAQMMQQEQMMQAEPQMGQQPTVEAYGGRINRFDDGGFTNWWNNYIAHSSNLKNIDWNRLYESITGIPASEGLDISGYGDVRSAVRNALKEYYETNPAVFRPYSATSYSWIQPSNGATSFYDFSNIRPVNVGRTQEDPMARFIGKSQRQIFAELAKSDFDSSDAELQRKASEIYEQLQKADRAQAANKWLIDNHPEYSDDVRNKLTEMMASSRSAIGSSGRFKPELAFKGLVPTYNFSDSNYANYVKKLVDNGISFDDAFNIARTFSPDKDSDTSERSRRQLKNRIREKANITETAVQPVKTVQSAPTTSQGVTSNRSYLDFPDIPDTGYMGGSNTQYENAVNSATDFNAARTSFLKSVSPQKIGTVRDILNNLSDEQKQQFLSLDTPEKQIEFITDAYKNQNQNSSNIAPAESAIQNQQNTTQRGTAKPSTYRNVGKLKEDSQTAWRDYVLPGLNKYIDDWEDKINNATTQEERNALVDQMVTEFNGLQQSYNDNVWPNIGKSGYYYDPKVEGHQRDWSRMYGNTGFFVAQPDGTTVDAVGQAVNKAGSMGDNPEDGGIDGYNGPNTSLRNYGATIYGNADFYKPIIDRFRNLGVNYKLSDTLKNGDDALYVLSRRTPQSSAPAALTRNGKGELQGVLNSVRTPIDTFITIGDKAPAANTTAGSGTPVTTESEEKYIYKPKLANETNIGLFGPIAGLTMQAMGIGKPDYTGLDRAQSIANRPVKLASYQPIGDYIRYSPFDLWAAQNRLDANNRATQRAILNQYSPSRDANQIALAYAENIGAGQAQRQAAESNLAQKLQAAEFNRGTNKANADAFNAVSQFNAGQLNTGNRFKAQAALQDAAYRMDADAGWYNSIYGNVSNQFKNIAAREREKRQHNMIARMAADGLFNNITPEQFIASDFVDWAPAANGGKLRRKKNKRRGLTI